MVLRLHAHARQTSARTSSFVLDGAVSAAITSTCARHGCAQPCSIMLYHVCSWLYRIRPSVGHSKLERVPMPAQLKGDMAELVADPAQVGASARC